MKYTVKLLTYILLCLSASNTAFACGTIVNGNKVELCDVSLKLINFDKKNNKVDLQISLINTSNQDLKLTVRNRNDFFNIIETSNDGRTKYLNNLIAQGQRSRPEQFRTFKLPKKQSIVKIQSVMLKPENIKESRLSFQVLFSASGYSPVRSNEISFNY